MKIEEVSIPEGVILPEGARIFVQKEGYLRVRGADKVWLGFLHRIIWEQLVGPIPEGFCVHHSNFIPTDNRIENMGLMSRSTHSKLHKRLRELGEHSNPIFSRYYLAHQEANRKSCREFMRRKRAAQKLQTLQKAA